MLGWETEAQSNTSRHALGRKARPGESPAPPAGEWCHDGRAHPADSGPVMRGRKRRRARGHPQPKCRVAAMSLFIPEAPWAARPVSAMQESRAAQRPPRSVPVHLPSPYSQRAPPPLQEGRAAPAPRGLCPPHMGRQKGWETRPALTLHPGLGSVRSH